jgi:hypothetical protein
MNPELEPFPTITGAPCPKCGGLRQYIATQQDDDRKTFDRLHCTGQWSEDGEHYYPCDMASAPCYSRSKMDCIRSWNAITFRLLTAGNNQQNSQDRSRPTCANETSPAT